MTKTEHAVGSRFEVDGIIYEVQLTESCRGCACFIEGEGECTDSRSYRFGMCCSGQRSDGNDVRFVQVGERN